jgi:hypothetical protein
LAGYDPDQLDRVLDWDVRDGLLAIEARMKDEAMADHRHAELIWAVLAAGGKSKDDRGPTPPPILRA